MLRLLTLVLIVTSCALLPSVHRHRKEVRNQVIPNELLNKEWVLETYDEKSNACQISISFLEKGKFRFNVDGTTFEGKHIQYLFDNSSVKFSTRPIGKIYWGDGYKCELDPDGFARELQSDFSWIIKGERLFLGNNHSKFVFKKK